MRTSRRIVSFTLGLVVFLVASVYDTVGSTHRLLRAEAKKNEEESVLICRLTVVDTLVGSTFSAEEEEFGSFGSDSNANSKEENEWLTVMKQHEESGEIHYGCIPIQDHQETDQLYAISLPSTIADDYKANITEGNLFVSIHGASIDHETNQVILNDVANFQVMDRLPPRMRHLQELPITTGMKEIFIVRVSATDSTPTKSLDELQQGIISMNSISFQSQFYACSFGQLQWKLAGGVDVQLPRSIHTYNDPSQLLQAAQDVAKEKMNVDDLRSLADHVVFCQPPGVDGWIAVAAVNHWYSNFHNDWCLSLSALMHEIGHNLGLLHSGYGGVAYGDVSGFMGFGTNSETYPRKCFNGVKSWQLGWYQDRHLRVEPQDTTTTISLAAFVDYPKANQNEPVVINIADKFFLMYNRAKGFNTDTQAMEDLVTITENTPSWSNSRAGLDAGDRFMLTNFRPGQSLIVEVCAAKDGGSSRADLMVVSISLDRSHCGDTAGDDNNSNNEDDADDENNNTGDNSCKPLNTPCIDDSECCSSNQRCLDRSGSTMCRYCRIAGQRCSVGSDCCRGLSCDLMSGTCEA